MAGCVIVADLDDGKAFGTHRSRVSAIYVATGHSIARSLLGSGI